MISLFPDDPQLSAIAQLAIIVGVVTVLWVVTREVIRRAGSFRGPDFEGYVIAPPDRRVSVRCAKDRRAFLSKYLKSPTPLEILEAPSGLDVGQRRELGEMEAIGQFVRFKSYAESTPLMLMDRAVDLLELMVRTKVLPKASSFTFHLEFSDRKSSEARLPWTLVIGCSEEEKLAAFLREYSTWLGIAVVVRPPSAPVELHGLCLEPGGREGTCGGRIRSGASSGFDVTCDHVLSPQCQSVASPRISAGSTLAPDIAFVRSAPCFEITNSVVPVHPMTSDEVIKSIEEGIAVAYSIRSPLRRGAMIAPAGGYRTEDGAFWRTPCVMIEAPGIRWPLQRLLGRNQRFSHAGDSGSWVVLAPDSHNWLGMVVGADTSLKISYVIEANVVASYAALWLRGSAKSAAPAQVACEAFV